MPSSGILSTRLLVTPLAGVWIEILTAQAPTSSLTVTPLAGVWIEIVGGWGLLPILQSHPPRGGVDRNCPGELDCDYGVVTPLAGVWIEIISGTWRTRPGLVTPLAGVWIEIGSGGRRRTLTWVTPLAGVWIEISTRHSRANGIWVTPLAGVWIEIGPGNAIKPLRRRHPPRGGVDRNDRVREPNQSPPSPPSRGCGSKFFPLLPVIRGGKSPPSRGCGSKLDGCRRDGS